MPRASTQNAVRTAPAAHPSQPDGSGRGQPPASLLFRSQGLELSHRDAAEALAKAFAAQQSGACNLLIAFGTPAPVIRW